MTLSESVAKLQSLLPVLKSGDAKFAADLIASYKKYGGLTPKQEPWIVKLIARAEAPAPVFSAPLAAPAAVSVGGFEGVVALFLKAKEHLKFPKVRLSLDGKAVVLSLNGPKSKNPGHITVNGEGQYPNRTFYGRVSPEGQFFAGHIDPAVKSALVVLLTQFASHPARVAKEHGKLTGNCCFCNKVLGLGEDKRSVLVGFGPVCAEHYGLKAEWLSGVAKAEAKASVAPTLSVQDEVIESLVTGSNYGIAASFLTPSPEQAGLVALDTVAQDTNPDELQAELGPEYGTSEYQAKEAYAAVNEGIHTCFFCEKTSAETKTLHDITVCVNCISQLA